MADRVRHCVECPECCTRYLIGFSPYLNGAYLVSFVSETSEEYKLICSCRRPAVCSRWNGRDLKTYSVSNEAYARGYGEAEEIWQLKDRVERNLSLMSLNLHREGRRDER